jgi:hypothetical protein
LVANAHYIAVKGLCLSEASSLFFSRDFDPIFKPSDQPALEGEDELRRQMTESLGFQLQLQRELAQTRTLEVLLGVYGQSNVQTYGTAFMVFLALRMIVLAKEH